MEKPDNQYLETARLLKELMETQEASKRYKERRRLESLLRKKFESAFALLPDRRKLAYKLYWRFCNTPCAPRSELFDHVDYFQRGENLVVVSQPYGFDKNELIRWAAECGASYSILNEWGYYFPGRASLFLVEFTPEAKAELDKRLRNPRNAA
jgi:hypothetical protein